MIRLVLLIAVLFIALRFTGNPNVGIPEHFRANEPMNVQRQGARGLCHDMAYFNCRAPTWTNNDCWMGTYKKCMKNCNAGPRGAGNACNCHLEASKNCLANNAPANACFNSTYQKCMSGMFANVPDPDRQNTFF